MRIPQPFSSSFRGGVMTGEPCLRVSRRGRYGPAFCLLIFWALPSVFAPAAIAQNTNPSPPSPSSAYRFAGTVEIVGQPADVGTVVQIAIFTAGRTFQVCADTKVDLYGPASNYRPPNTPNWGPVAGYTAPLYQLPACLNPDNHYEFYVNGVWAGSTTYGFYSTIPTYKNLSVSEVALKTSRDQSGVRLAWFYGKVTDAFGRPPQPGTEVIAEAEGASCQGRGTTQSLYWAPKFPGSKTVGVNGFYWIAIEITDSCADRAVMFKIYADDPKRAVHVQLSTPPYARAVAVPQTVLASH